MMKLASYIVLSLMLFTSCKSNDSNEIEYHLSSANACFTESDVKLFDFIENEETIISYTKPWENYKINYVTAGYYNNCYYLWYESKDKFYGDDLKSTICLATSKDGLTWVKPKLSLYKYDNQLSNIVYDGDLTNGAHAPFVYIDTISNKGEKFKMIFVGQDNYTLFGMQSKDGVTWSEPFQLLSGGGRDSQNSFYYSEIDKKFKFTLRSVSERLRGVRLFSASEFKENSLSNESVVYKNRINCLDEKLQIYTPAFNLVNGRKIGLPTIIDTEKNLCYPLFAETRNENHLSLNWDQELIDSFGDRYKQIFIAPNFIKRGNQYEVFYTASTVYHPNENIEIIYKANTIGRLKFKINSNVTW